MDEGILIYAHNNELIDYAMMAYCCALLAKHHLRRPVCLVTDHETWTDFKTRCNRIDVFDHVEVLKEFNPRKSSRRNYGSRTNVYYHNKTRDTAYQITPFDKTLVLDSDYLILDDRLKYIWDMEQPMMANRRTVDISKPLHFDKQKLSDISIPLYWATIFYFEKPLNEVENFFMIWKKVSKNFNFYSHVYNYRSAMYRNDFAFSVAETTAAGYDYNLGCREPFCNPLPVPYILTSCDTDEIVDIDRSGVLLKARWNRISEIPCKITSSFHCTNKISLQNHLPKIVELYE